MFSGQIKKKKNMEEEENNKKVTIGFLFGEDVIHNVRIIGVNFLTILGNYTCSENKRNKAFLSSSLTFTFRFISCSFRREHSCH